MPKLGMEPLRRRALIDAAIDAVGDHGSLAVTMAEIARRAGVSAALAHHYFGTKDKLLHSAMRHILAELRQEASSALAVADTPRARLTAIVSVSFSEVQFRQRTIAAWLAFYVEAQRSPAIRRLLRIYTRRLHSNLLHALRPLAPAGEADRIAQAVAALIDGLYIRHALKEGLPDAAEATALVEDFLETKLANPRGTA